MDDVDKMCDCGNSRNRQTSQSKQSNATIDSKSAMSLITASDDKDVRANSVASVRVKVSERLKCTLHESGEVTENVN